MDESSDTQRDDSFWKLVTSSLSVGLVLTVTLIGSALFVFGNVGWAIAVSVAFFWIAFSRRSETLRIISFGLACVFLVPLLLPGMGHPRVISEIGESKGNLRQIGLALHNYHDTYLTFPPAFVADEEGRRNHSWRVLILPYLELQPFYEQYDLSEPWNSPRNQEIGTKAFEVFNNPIFARSPSAAIHYFAVTGPHAAWPGIANRCHAVPNFPKGTSMTVLVIENSAVAATWSEPRDLTLDEAIDALSHPDPEGPWLEMNWFYDDYLGRHVLFADGTVRTLMPMSRDNARKLLRIDGNDSIDEAAFANLTSTFATRPRRYHFFKYPHKLAAFGIFMTGAFMPGLLNRFLKRRSNEGIKAQLPD